MKNFLMLFVLSFSINILTKDFFPPSVNSPQIIKPGNRLPKSPSGKPSFAGSPKVNLPQGALPGKISPKGLPALPGSPADLLRPKLPKKPPASLPKLPTVEDIKETSDACKRAVDLKVEIDYYKNKRKAILAKQNTEATIADVFDKTQININVSKAIFELEGFGKTNNTIELIYNLDFLVYLGIGDQSIKIACQDTNQQSKDVDQDIQLAYDQMKLLDFLVKEIVKKLDEKKLKNNDYITI